MDITDLASIGARIVEIGQKLKVKKTERESLDKVISELEGELMPLVTEHAKLIASVVGSAIPAPAPAPTMMVTPSVQPTPQPGQDPLVKKRILEYLKSAEEPGSAQDVADALRLDPLIVRQVMSELARGR